MSRERDVDLDRVAQLYTDSLGRHGTAPRGVGWRDGTDHELRFEKLAVVIEDRETPVSVNDLGCGYGALLEFLRSQGLAVSRFNGYDISAEMLATAAERIGGPGVDLITGDVLDRDADYSFASGIFNVKFDTPEEVWADHVRATVRNLCEHSTKGFTFNALTTHVDYREPHLFYADPLEYFDFCKRELSSRVALLHDYPLYEWTILARP